MNDSGSFKLKMAARDLPMHNYSYAMNSSYRMHYRGKSEVNTTHTTYMSSTAPDVVDYLPRAKLRNLGIRRSTLEPDNLEGPSTKQKGQRESSVRYSMFYPTEDEENMIIGDLVKSTFHQVSRDPAAADDVEGQAQTHKIKECKTFGRINFRKDAKSAYEPPYVRLHPSDSKAAVLDLMTGHWKVSNPKLIVSIVGGARRFEFSKGRIQGMFNQGLLDIAKTTGAWIITPGSNTGLYRMVGSALKDHIDSTGSAVMNEIVLLGIASWGSVAGKELLEDETGQGKNPAVYHIADIPVVRGIQPLDPNHSHFILVDDGSAGEFGGELKWRVEFEKFLTEHVLSHEEDGSGGVNIPIVTLLVNGGDGSLEACYESLGVQIPLVAIAGSGRAAEVIVQLHKLFNTHYADKTNSRDDGWRPSTATFTEIYEKAMGQKISEDVITYLEVISNNHEYISVFDFTKASSSYLGDVGLDKAILSALYPKNVMTSALAERATTISKRRAQMRLALAWNRVDYARNDILDPNNPEYKELLQQKEFFHEVLMEALIDDMPKFVELFLDHGVDLESFVTSKRLEKLYQKTMQRQEAYARMVNKCFGDEKSAAKGSCTNCTNSVDPNFTYMFAIGMMLKKLMCYSYPNIYKEGSIAYAKDSIHFRDPAQQLFLWATMFNRMDLAIIFWKYSQDHIAGAIVGAGILRGLAKASDDHEGIDIKAEYLKNSQKFEVMANGILELCWTKDRQYTSDMLIRVTHNWAKTTVLALAYNAEMEEFLAQPACYSKINKIWRGDISLQTSLWRIIAFAINPLLVFLLTFARKNDGDPRTDEINQHNEIIEADESDMPNKEEEYNSTSSPTLKRLIQVVCKPKSNYEISYFSAMYRAFTSPMVKCVHYSLMYMSFLIIYSLFLMTELRPFIAESVNNQSLHDGTCNICCVSTTSSHIGCLEAVTYCFVLANFLEEVRQVMFRDTRSIKRVKQKLSVWLRDTWNRVDVASYIAFVVAAVFRFFIPEAYFEWSRLLFCFSLLIFIVRFSQIFFVVEKLGPKIIMIKKMMVDLIFFLVILAMTILTFGVISQSILHPQASLAWSLINDVIYKPYFQMYGELFLDEFNDGVGYRWILLGIYMILTNILLINLLIAMFSYTFERVQEKSEILWKFNYYAVVYEHFDRSYIPLIGTIFQMFRHSRCCGCCGEMSSDFRRKLDRDLDSKVTKFVRSCMESYVSQQTRLKHEDITHKVTNTADRLELVIEQLDDLREDVQRNQQPDSPFSRQISMKNPSRSSSDHAQHTLHMLEAKLENKLGALEGLKSKLESKIDAIDHLKSHVDDKLARLENVENKLDNILQLLSRSN